MTPDVVRTPFDDFADFVLQATFLDSQLLSFYELSIACNNAANYEEDTANCRRSILAACERLYGAEAGKQIAMEIIAADKADYTEAELQEKAPQPGHRKLPKEREATYLNALIRNTKKLKTKFGEQALSNYVAQQLQRWQDKKSPLAVRIFDIFRHHWQAAVAPFQDPELNGHFQESTSLTKNTINAGMAKFDKLCTARIPDLCAKLRASPVEPVDPDYFKRVLNATQYLPHPELRQTLLDWHKPFSDALENAATNIGPSVIASNNDSSVFGIFKSARPATRPPTPTPPNVRPGR